jgi:hypothetical protein
MVGDSLSTAAPQLFKGVNVSGQLECGGASNILLVGVLMVT